jgi:hypothetical protein
MLLLPTSHTDAVALQQPPLHPVRPVMLQRLVHVLEVVLHA